jgi:uncharacterized Zn finger protein (UPF0148 family)
MFCKKCGTEQKDGQKFCPKCGEPFLDENGKPYLKGFKKDMQDAKDKLASKVDELTQQGKKLVDEKVQPHLNEKIDELKKVDWEGKKEESVKSIEGFFSNTDKLRKATIGIAIVAVLWFFIFNHGFSASWTWWLFAIAFIVAAFYKMEAKDEHDALNKARWSLGLAVILGLVLVFHSPSRSAFGGMDDEINYKASNTHDEEIILKMSKVYGEINSILPQVESLYNVHQQHIASGGNPNFSPAWGKWQDCRNRIMKLWDEYISLARQLDDSEDIIEEAREKKRIQDKAFEEMFVPRY